MAELRKQAGRFTWKINQGLARRLILIIKTLVWPLVAFIQILTLLCTSSKEVATMNRRSQIRQLFDLIYFTFWRGFPPEEYYKTSFYNENLFLVIDDFISGKELLILNSLISEGRDPALINNKLRFDEHCRNNHLAVVPILEIYSNGEKELFPLLFPNPFYILGYRVFHKNTFFLVLCYVCIILRSFYG